MLYVEHYSKIDSDPGGVHANNLGRLLLANSDDFAVMRLKEPYPLIKCLKSTVMRVPKLGRDNPNLLS